MSARLSKASRDFFNKAFNYQLRLIKIKKGERKFSLLLLPLGMKQAKPLYSRTIADLHHLMSLTKPLHALVSIFDFSSARLKNHEPTKRYILGYYCVMLKKDYEGKMHYGQSHYDFDKGIMSFIAPNQMVSRVNDLPILGTCLAFHPDFIRSSPLSKKINDYGFFSYAVNEALHLSEKEEKMIERVLTNIKEEYETAADDFSQEVMVSHIDLLLTYCNRFYHRQFVTRKKAKNNLLSRFEDVLNEYFRANKANYSELPTVQSFAEKLFVSPTYLNDMLKGLTGKTTQQHIHEKIIEEAKELLSRTDLSVGEISYKLGFEYPQSFNKLFKKKTNSTPLKFRKSCA
jgi:AraC-like DNA-binding protein